MSHRAAPKRSLKVNPHWNIEVLKEDLKKKDRSLRNILKSRATDEVGWSGLYNDTKRWREMDPDLQKLIDENAEATRPGFKQPGGRKRKDIKANDTDWRLRYVETYLSTNSRDQAAEVTPYNAREIYAMLTPGRSEFDKLFFEMMEVAEQRQVGRAAETAYNAMKEAVDTGASPKDKAYIALGILKTNPKGWQQKQQLEVSVSGTIKHQLDRQRVVGELLADQQRFFAENRPLALTEGVIEAEEVPSDVD